jgi:hypothetical protein
MSAFAFFDIGTTLAKAEMSLLEKQHKENVVGKETGYYLLN